MQKVCLFNAKTDPVEQEMEKLCKCQHVGYNVVYSLILMRLLFFTVSLQWSKINMLNQMEEMQIISAVEGLSLLIATKHTFHHRFTSLEPPKFLYVAFNKMHGSRSNTLAFSIDLIHWIRSKIQNQSQTEYGLLRSYSTKSSTIKINYPRH